MQLLQFKLLNNQKLDLGCSEKMIKENKNFIHSSAGNFQPPSEQTKIQTAQTTKQTNFKMNEILFSNPYADDRFQRPESEQFYMQFFQKNIKKKKNQSMD
jgi:hypothetical protein